jgi:hypothetical protein
MANKKKNEPETPTVKTVYVREKPRSKLGSVVRINPSYDLDHRGERHTVILTACTSDGEGVKGDDVVFQQIAPKPAPGRATKVAKDGYVVFEVTGITGNGMHAHFHLLGTGHDEFTFLKGPTYGGKKEKPEELPTNAGFFQKLLFALLGGRIKKVEREDSK